MERKLRILHLLAVNQRRWVKGHYTGLTSWARLVTPNNKHYIHVYIYIYIYILKC